MAIFFGKFMGMNHADLEYQWNLLATNGGWMGVTWRFLLGFKLKHKNDDAKHTTYHPIIVPFKAHKNMGIPLNPNI